MPVLQLTVQNGLVLDELAAPVVLPLQLCLQATHNSFCTGCCLHGRQHVYQAAANAEPSISCHL